MEPITSRQRLKTMRPLPRAALATLIFSSLAACGQSSATEGTAEHNGSIVVTSVQKPGDQGRRYIEGAVTHVILRDPSGQQITPAAGDGPLRFTNLPPGEYKIEPALRPCSGSCDFLDPRRDSCSAVVQVDTGMVRLHVVYRVSEPCQIRDEAPTL